MYEYKKMLELRFHLGHGYLRLRIASGADMIRILILTRNCKSGLTYNKNSSEKIVWAKTLEHYNDILRILKQHGYCDPKQL